MPTNGLKDLEFADNPDQRCACVLLLDTSGSMDGQRINDLNAGLHALKDELLEDNLARTRVDLSVITFDTEVKVVRDFGTIENFEPPLLKAQYQTFMGTAICQALDKIEARIVEYKTSGIPYYRPWLFLLTDGHPEGEASHTIEEAKRRIRKAQANNKVKVFPVGVGQEVDLSELADITGTEALRLKETEFNKLFLWLGRSLTMVSNSQDVGAQIALPPPSWRTA